MRPRKNGMSPGTPTNFRLSEQTIDLLNEASSQSGLTKTQIVEMSVLRHALNIPALAEQARAALADIASRSLLAHESRQIVGKAPGKE